MGFVVTLAVFAVVLSLLVLVHEIGHYGAARLLGVRVRELGVGFPPRIHAVSRGGIEYSINALPFGGFVRLYGEDDPSQPDGFAAQSIRVRTAIIAAGAVMNLLLAWVIFSGFAAAVLGPVADIAGDVVVRDVAEASPADRAGIMPGDRLDEVDGIPVTSANQLADLVDRSTGSPVTLRVIRGAVPMAVQLVPRADPPQGEGAMGVTIAFENAALVRERIPLWRAPVDGALIGAAFFVEVGREVRRWGAGTAEPDLAGPVGIAQITGEAARNGLVDLIWLVAVLSLNLAVLNILPIPALDGGRLLFLLIETVRGGRRISSRVEGMIHLAGFAVLIGLIITVTLVVDIPRALSGDTILPAG